MKFQNVEMSIFPYEIIVILIYKILVCYYGYVLYCRRKQNIVIMTRNTDIEYQWFRHLLVETIWLQAKLLPE